MPGTLSCRSKSNTHHTSYLTYSPSPFLSFLFSLPSLSFFWDSLLATLHVSQSHVQPSQFISLCHSHYLFSTLASLISSPSLFDTCPTQSSPLATWHMIHHKLLTPPLAHLDQWLLLQANMFIINKKHSNNIHVKTFLTWYKLFRALGLLTHCTLLKMAQPEFPWTLFTSSFNITLMVGSLNAGMM